MLEINYLACSLMVQGLLGGAVIYDEQSTCGALLYASQKSREHILANFSNSVLSNALQAKVLSQG